MLDEALAYAARGWPVFPCHPNDKRPMVSSSKPRGAKNGGLYLATTDARQIREWWGRMPHAMIGVRTGPAIGAFVVDLDPGINAETGEVMSATDLLAEVETLIGQKLPPTRTSATPRGGWHLLFRWIPPAELGGEELGNSPGALPNFTREGVANGAHCDVRGEGGYICVAPSVRRGPKAVEEGCDGVAYRWLDAGAPIADAPPALIDCILRRGRFARDVRPGAPASPIDAAVTRLATPARGIHGAESEAEATAVRKYALSALDREAEEVARTPKNGGRNNRLNKAALVMGQLVAAGAIAASMVESVLEEACARNGLAGEDGWVSVRATIASGMEAGQRNPRDLSEIARKARNRSGRASGPLQPSYDEVFGPEDYGLPAPLASSPPAPSSPEDDRNSLPSGRDDDDGRQEPPIPPDGGAGGGGPPDDGDTRDEALDRRLAFLPLTDLGNAERFVERFGEHFRWCAALGWMRWDGTRWNRDGADGALVLAAHRTVRSIQFEADAIRGTPADIIVDERRGLYMSDRIAAWGRSSESAQRLAGIAKHGAPYIEVQVRELDADPWRINVKNGTIVVHRERRGSDLPLIEFRPHDPRDLITKMANVVYDPAAAAPIYDDFLAFVQPTPAVRRFLDQWGGYSLIGDTSEQKLAFFYGKGKNGKSTLNDVWGFLAGDYGETVPIETFLDQGRQRGAGQATPDLALLPGVRMLRTSEPEKGSKLAESLIKSVTGGEPIQARHLNKDFFKFYPSFKLTMSGNFKPDIMGADDGIWRRMMLVPWLVTVPEDRRDRQLGDKLRREASGILNRLLDGLCDLVEKGGLVTPAEVTKATEDYRSDSDPLGRFLAVCTERKAGERVQSSLLHEVYTAWATANGEPRRSAKRFSLDMGEQGFVKKQSDVMWWLDLRLTKSVGDFVDHEGRPRHQDGTARLVDALTTIPEDEEPRW